ncbi:MAG: methylmalonyl-CoA epimerase [Deltaproteobacteria bacterium]|nr:methylmalonyl-CoA epimerase [Deltaproteobacteria bacterium]
MIKRIHHVAIAVADLDEGEAAWGPHGIGLPAEGREDVASQKTSVAMFPVGESRIELIQPMSEDSAVAKHLAKRGPGIHHICMEVDDLRAEMARLKAAGLRFTSDEPAPGAHGSLVAFVHPKSTGGVLLELNEFATDEEGAHE